MVLRKKFSALRVNHVYIMRTVLYTLNVWRSPNQWLVYTYEDLHPARPQGGFLVPDSHLTRTLS